MSDENYHYIGETRVRHKTRNHEHSQTDRNSAIYRHSRENGYVPESSNFSILAKGYPNWQDRKICEALFINDHKPILNKQMDSYKLQLFS